MNTLESVSIVQRNTLEEKVISLPFPLAFHDFLADQPVTWGGWGKGQRGFLHITAPLFSASVLWDATAPAYFKQVVSNDVSTSTCMKSWI